MIRIAVTVEAFEAIAATLPLGSVGYRGQARSACYNCSGQRRAQQRPTRPDQDEDRSFEMAATNDIDIEYLRQCLSLDETGALRWRERPPEHFPSAIAWGMWNEQWTGTAAGWPDRKGDLNVELTVGGKLRILKTHRVVYALTHDCWPEAGLDHG
jgi:hypothetical protein